MLRSARYPDLYHGWGKQRDFFEGWYFKLVDPCEQHVFAFIPGIFLGRSQAESHSFLQVVNGSEARLDYLRFAPASFGASRREFAINVDASEFSLASMRLDAATGDLTARGTIDFHNVQRWPDSILSPGSMGFYNYLPRMQCYSQVCAMDMDLTGSLVINGRTIDFTGGRGYVEKNWGRAFPYSWVWLQSNNFAPPARRASLSCSLGHIPMPWGSFRGFLVGLYIDGRFYEFTSMNQTQSRVVRSGADVSIELWNRKHRLLLDARTDPAKFVLLKGPRNGQMVPLVQENLFGTIAVRLTVADSGECLFAGDGCCSGVEYGGDQMLVLDGAPQPTVSTNS